MENKNMDYVFSDYRFSDFRLDRCSNTVITESQTERIHINRGYAFIFFTTGNAKISCLDKKAKVTRGSGVAVPFGATIQITPTSPDGVSFISVRITGESVRQFFNTIEKKDGGPIMGIPENSKILDSAIELMNECSKSYRTDLSLLSCFYEFLRSIDDHYVEKKVPTKNAYMAKAVEYIKHNYNKNISVESIADLLGIERSYLSRLFKTYKNKSTQNYIIDFRISRAKKLFEEEDMNVSQVSAAVGYTNIYCFSRIFKSRVGMPPKEYMERCKKRGL